MTSPEIDIRPMRRAELDLTLDWAAAEGWNPGLHDADVFFAADPNGYFLALEQGEPIGCVSAVAYDQAFGFVGFFIVKPGRRGGKVGLLLGQRALAYLGPRTIGLDGVEKKEKNYMHYGFARAWQNIRYAGLTCAGPTPASLRPAAGFPFARLAEYDRHCFPAERSRFLAAWISRPGSVALALSDGAVLAGYGVIRPCRRGYKIGPLFAEHPAFAQDLFQGLLAAVPPNQPVYLDAPGANPEALALAERWRMKPVFRTVRMYKPRPVELPVGNIYGVTSFELG